MNTPVASGRIYFPPEDESKPNERVAMHPETDSDNVLMPSGKTLQEHLGPQIVVSPMNERPTIGACLWAAVTATRETP